MNCQQVLLIDDEANVLKSLQRLFRREPVTVQICETPEDALAFVAATECAVVVSDQRMPTIQGSALLEKIRQVQPHSIRMTLTGYADKEAAIDAINLGAVSRFLTKPWNDDELRQTILGAVDEYNMRAEVRRLQEMTANQNRQLQELNASLEQRVEERTAQISQLNKNLRTSFMTSIAVMAQLGELHSPVVGSHSQRVARLVREMATFLKLSAEEINTCFSAALLHDIGKMGLPAQLLMKDPQTHTENERQSLRKHPAEGERIVSMVPALRESAACVRSHHERWNGTGFPDRISGTAIPLGARLIAVADLYDNTLNNRQRFEGMTAEKALAFVQKLSGTWFDPEAVTALKSVVQAEAPASDVEDTVEVSLRDLRPGMQLARPLMTVKGVMLLPAYTLLTSSQLERVRGYVAADPLDGAVHVLRRSTLPKPDDEQQPEGHTQTQTNSAPFVPRDVVTVA